MGYGMIYETTEYHRYFNVETWPSTIKDVKPLRSFFQILGSKRVDQSDLRNFLHASKNKMGTFKIQQVYTIIIFW